MALDRDLGVAVATALSGTAGGRRWNAWEMLAATGVRGLRVAAESDLLGELLMTEANPAAFAVLSRNASRYEGLGARARLHDAREPVADGPFDLIDLDPYGSPAPFLPVMLARARVGTHLAVTATDLRVLAGVDRGACERHYGARPVRGRLGPEGGLRILLGWIARSVEARGQSVHVLLGYVCGHYVRAYLEVVAGGGAPAPIGRYDPAEGLGPSMAGSGSFGPMWTGSLFDVAFVRRLGPPATAARPRPVATLIGRFQEEAGIDGLFYYEPNELARTLHLPDPPAVGVLLDALHAAGWPAARTHVRAGGIRTPAPRAEVERAAEALRAR